MPAKSKDQQAAAGIALKAKKEDNVDDLRPGAAKEMAKSMSKKELEDLASTDTKDLPKEVKSENVGSDKRINKIIENWEKALMVQEEMLGMNDEEGQISTKNSKSDRVKSKNSKKKKYKDKWPNAVAAVAGTARNISTNTTGARVAEEVDPNSLDIIFEQDEDPVKYLPPDETVDAAVEAGDSDVDDGDDLDEASSSNENINEEINTLRWKKLAGVVKG